MTFWTSVTIQALEKDISRTIGQFFPLSTTFIYYSFMANMIVGHDNIQRQWQDISMKI